MMRLSVIIPAYNHLELVMRAYQSISATTDRALTEVLVQDDASTEYNGELMFPAGVCQRNSPNLGFAGNCNAGAKRAAGEVLMFFNQDALVTVPGWDRVLLDRFDSTPECAIVGPTILFPDGRVQSVGGLFDAKGQPFHNALGSRNPDWTPIATPRPVSWVTGAALAIRRDVWNMLGGFDTIYGRGYFEDVDLCVRAQLEGHQIWHEPGVRLFHDVGSTGGNPSFRKNAETFRRRWVNTGYVQPDINYVREAFWL